MPILTITEYIDTANGTPVEPPCAHQTVALTDQPVESAPFHKQARCIRITSDVNCLIGFGQAAIDPQCFIEAKTAELRIIHPGAGFRLSAVLASSEASSGGIDSLNSGIAFFTLLTDAKKYRALLDRLIKAKDDAHAATAALGDSKTKANALLKERTIFEAWTTSQKEQLEQSRVDLETERQQFETEKSELATTAAVLAEDRAVLEASKRDHGSQLSELSRLRKILAA